MPAWKVYHLARSVPDALEALRTSPGPARLVGGGTDLLLDLQQGRHPALHTLVDVTHIPEMTVLEVRDGRLFIGAAVPLYRIVASPQVAEHAEALHESTGLIGGPQVRNTATLGGNVSHALPAADGAISLVAMDAVAEVAGAYGRRQVPMLDLYAGPGKSTLDPCGEVLVGFHLPLKRPGEGSGFQRIMRPQGVAIAILNMSTWLRQENGRVAEARIALGPAGPVPQRARQAEAVLRGQDPLQPEVQQEALEALLAEVRFRTSPHRATAEYRRRVAGVLLADTLAKAWERANTVSTAVPAGA